MVDIETEYFGEFGRSLSLPLKTDCFKISQKVNQFSFINDFIILTSCALSGGQGVLGHTINILHASQSLIKMFMGFVSKNDQ